MKLKLLIFFAAVLVGCSQQTTVPDQPRAELPSAPAASLDDIRSAAVSSQCAKFSFNEQGRPPGGYLRGIALTYARALCNPSGLVSKVGGQAVGPSSDDALALYSQLIKDQGLSVATAPDRLRVVFSLMVGSAARESSWRWCVGKDPGADNTDSSTCEAGIYQTSYNGRYDRDGKTLNPSRAALYSAAKTVQSGCFAIDYKGNTTCSAANLKNWGTGEGLSFQALSKDCPGFASEYHALMLRERRSHYGPINTKQAQVTKQCASMLAAVEDIVARSPSVCSLLN